MRRVLGLGGISLGALAQILATPLCAQTVASSDGVAETISAAENAAPEGLEDIVVTAQRRAERLQDVPVTVTALTASALETSGISDTTDLQVAVPGLVTQQVANAFLPFIRGVGSNQTGNGIESSVAVYLDGVYQGVKSGNVIELANIERIEVLKGPQGTLFGRNATGGAINIVTRDPSTHPELKVELGYGRFDERKVRAYASGPVTDTLSAGIAFTGRWSDGYIRDIYHDRIANPNDSMVVMGKLRWTPSDRLTVDLSASYSHLNDPTFSTVHVRPGTTAEAEATGGLVTHDPSETALSRAKNVQKSETSRLSLHLNYDAGPFDVVSITGYVDGFSYNFRENDASVANIQHLSTGQPSEQFTQEFQLQSNGGGPFSWITGAYYLWLKEGFGKGPHDQVLQINLPSIVRPADLLVPGALARGTSALITAESKSLFAQATYNVAPSTRMTAGLRYSMEKKSAKGEQYRYVAVPGNGSSGIPMANGVLAGDGLVFGTVPLASMDLSKEWKRLTWRLALDHDFARDVMGYASYSRGFKTGGYVPGQVSNAQVPVNPEVLDAFEVGVKSEWLNRRLRFNLSAFYYDYRDIQVALVTAGGTSMVQNAASARLYGIDLDVVAMPTKNLTVRGGLNLLDSRYKNYSNAQLLLPKVDGAPCQATPRQIDMNTAREIAALPQTGGGCTYSLNANGLDTIIAPKVTANVGLDYEVQLPGSSRLMMTSSFYYNDGYDTAPGGLFTHVGSFESVSAAVTWFAPDDRYFIRLWGDNLTNDRHPESILPTGTAFQEVSSRPRTYGVTLGFSFGG